MDQGKKVLFMTNNSSKTRAVILAKLHKLGFTKVPLCTCQYELE